MKVFKTAVRELPKLLNKYWFSGMSCHKIRSTHIYCSFEIERLETAYTYKTDVYISKEFAPQERVNYVEWQ